MTAPEPASWPTVSILIPCYERADALRETLTELRSLDYPALEIVVLDDGSPTADIKGVAGAFSEVRFARTPTNRGLIAARNHGASICGGKYLFNLDDDSWPTTPDLLRRAVAWMEADERIGVLAFTIAERGGPVPPSLPDTAPVPTAHYVGCGNLYRASVIRAVGPYREEFVRQLEETERSLRVWDAGYTVAHAQGLVVHHDQSEIGRDHRRINAFNFLNRLRIELLRTPATMLPMGVLRALGFAARHRRAIGFDWVSREVRRDGVGGLWRGRRPVRAATLRAWRTLPDTGLIWRGPPA